LDQRCGISISKKVSKRAIVRNKLKRRIRSIFQSELENIQTGIDVIFVARKSLIDLPFSGLENIIKNLLKKAKLYKDK